VQVNSLGLTEQQPENNVYRILLEMLAVTLSKNARARAVQLPAWNEALGLPRPWDQQWSLRMQQIVAFETDLLEFGDIFDGSKEIERKVEELKAKRAPNSRASRRWAARSRRSNRLHEAEARGANTRRLEAIERGEQTVVGVNRFTETEPSPLTTGDLAILVVPIRHVEKEQVERLKRGAIRATRRRSRPRWRCEVRRAASEGANIMEPSIEAAKAGVTTGEWGNASRSIRRVPRADRRRPSSARASAEGLDEVRGAVEKVSKKLGRRVEIPGRQAGP
jgi:(2R)-ethylmalonyl-CoA mutase